MAHLLALVSNEKEKISNTYVNKLVLELVIGCYFYFTIIPLRILVAKLWQSYDKFVMILLSTYNLSKIRPQTIRRTTG